MLQVRCPKCATTLSFKQPPSGGKVKCPKCAAVISVGQPAQPASAARPTAGAGSGAPRQTPVAPPGFAGEIDFRNIPVPPMQAPNGHFPITGRARVYDGPISLDPLPIQRTGDEDDDDEPESEPQGKTPNNNKKAKQTKVIIGLVAGVVGLIAVGGVGFMLMGGASGGSGGATVDVAAD